MPTPANPNLLAVDWSKIPPPVDDGAARHLQGAKLPDIALAATTGRGCRWRVWRAAWSFFAYPRTGEPGKAPLVEDWDMIPGARGCTPQSCAFRDLHTLLIEAGATRVFGLSTQDPTFQLEAAERLHLPFPLLSDARLELTRALRLPTMQVAGLTLIKRLALVVDDGSIVKVFYPVFPPDRNAADVHAWLAEHRRR